MISMRIEKCRHLAIAAAAMAAWLNLFRAVAAPVPIQVSSNGHYFVNARGEPFYFLADTQWELFRRYFLLPEHHVDALSQSDGRLPANHFQTRRGHSGR